MVITGISIPAGGNAVIVYSARVNEFAPIEAGNTIENTVTVNGNGLTAPITDTFNPALTDLAVSYNGTPWTNNTEYTYNDATGSFNPRQPEHRF